jgi:hypothetical protein
MLIVVVRSCVGALFRQSSLVTIKTMNPATIIPIDNLSVADKIVLMERLWDDLSRCPADVAPPGWHGNVLDKRRDAVLAGSAAFVDWDSAKQRLRERLR